MSIADPAVVADKQQDSHRDDKHLIAALGKAIGAENVTSDSSARYLASRDASIFHAGTAGPLCFPKSTADVVACMKIAAAHNRAVVARGAGTGLAGNAAPLGNPVVLSLTTMRELLEIDLDNGVAWVQPGMVNLQLSKALAPYGLHYAPDPSSQQVCTIGGNVANNSGGPHCLAYGVTSAHVVALEVVLSDGSVVTLGGLDAESAGYDLRGAFVGSEGMCGIVTAAAVRILPVPAAVQTMLMSFGEVSQAAATVSAVIASGIVPAAMELMDQRCIQAVERFAGCGFPLDAAAVLLIEVDGAPGRVSAASAQVMELAEANGAFEVHTATSEAERGALWKGRKSSFGAVAAIAPDYYLHDTVVPRSRLVEVLTQIYDIADRYELTVLNVFHAGDGNLHPILAYDARDDGVAERVAAASREIIEVSLAAGGALSGEHGIGVEKRDFMELMFSAVDLEQQSRLRSAFDPYCRLNPGKVLPSAHSCSDIGELRAADGNIWG